MNEEYVSEEEGRKRFPNGAVIVRCKVCGLTMLAQPGAPEDCGRHEN